MRYNVNEDLKGNLDLIIALLFCIVIDVNQLACTNTTLEIIFHNIIKFWSLTKVTFDFVLLLLVNSVV